MEVLALAKVHLEYFWERLMRRQTECGNFEIGLPPQTYPPSSPLNWYQVFFPLVVSLVPPGAKGTLQSPGVRVAIF